VLLRWSHSEVNLTLLGSATLCRRVPESQHFELLYGQDPYCISGSGERHANADAKRTDTAATMDRITSPLPPLRSFSVLVFSLSDSNKVLTTPGSLDIGSVRRVFPYEGTTLL
jgi:hypothetical protein